MYLTEPSAINRRCSTIKSPRSLTARSMILLQMHPVVRMCAVDHQLDAGFCRRLAFKDPIGPIGPISFSSRNVPAETPRVAQLLRFCQIHLAPVPRLLGLLAFGSFSAFASRSLNGWH